MKSTCTETMDYYDILADENQSIHPGVDRETVNVNMSEGWERLSNPHNGFVFAEQKK